MKKLILILAVVVSAGATVMAFEKEKPKKEKAKKEKCCSKEMAKECARDAKKDGKSCCEKKAAE